MTFVWLLVGALLGVLVRTAILLRSISRRPRWEAAGTCGVDAGLLMLCDPCYVLHRRREEHAGIVVREGLLDPCFGATWSDFCDRLVERPGVTQFQGQGWTSAVVISGFGGDGRYPVSIARDSRGLVVAVMVDFTRGQ